VNASRARRGVTLIELVVVMALIGLLAGVAAPAFLSSTTAQSSTAGQRVTALIASARARAVEQGTVVTMTIDPATNRFWVDHPDTSGVIELPEGSLLHGDARVHFRFEPSGQVAADLLVVDERGTLRPIRFDRWTGEVTTDAR
jgi:prepilin-type N-terminal cleavage/methylation domain-containing protein